MTRRERHMRILESFGRHRVSSELHQISTPVLVGMLSDEGVEAVTRRIVTGRKLQEKLNAENRARLAKGAA